MGRAKKARKQTACLELPYVEKECTVTVLDWVYLGHCGLYIVTTSPLVPKCRRTTHLLLILWVQSPDWWVDARYIAYCSIDVYAVGCLFYWQCSWASGQTHLCKCFNRPMEGIKNNPRLPLLLRLFTVGALLVCFVAIFYAFGIEWYWRWLWSRIQPCYQYSDFHEHPLPLMHRIHAINLNPPRPSLLGAPHRHAEHINSSGTAFQCHLADDQRSLSLLTASNSWTFGWLCYPKQSSALSGDRRVRWGLVIHNRVESGRDYTYRSISYWISRLQMDSRSFLHIWCCQFGHIFQLCYCHFDGKLCSAEK